MVEKEVKYTYLSLSSSDWGANVPWLERCLLFSCISDDTYPLTRLAV